MPDPSPYCGTWMRDDRARQLYGTLVQCRRAMLWAIAERRTLKAARHARHAAHAARLFLARAERFGFTREEKNE